MKIKNIKKYIIAAIVIVGIFTVALMMYFIHEENGWKEDFASFSSNIMKYEVDYQTQPANNQLYEIQIPNEGIETDDYIYYRNMQTLRESGDKIYRYNKDTKETELVYVAEYSIDKSIFKFTTNDNKLILIYSNEVVVVDMFTGIENRKYIPKYMHIAVVGQDILYNLSDGSMWRQDIRTGKRECIDEIKTMNFVADDTYIYYKDSGVRAGYVSLYNQKTGVITKTDVFLEGDFYLYDGKNIMYE